MEDYIFHVIESAVKAAANSDFDFEAADDSKSDRRLRLFIKQHLIDIIELVKKDLIVAASLRDFEIKYLVSYYMVCLL